MLKQRKDTELRRIRYIPDHNWQEVGVNVFECKDCTAGLDQTGNRTIYTPGNGDCE